MKQDDFERLKAICEKEGFECSDVFSDGRVAIVEKKNDPWEGVEFVECVDDNGSGKGCYTIGRIYPVKTVAYDTIQTTIDDSGEFNGWNKRFFKPSTETAYVEQLKKEAFERFGEIKEGDRFDFTNVGFTKQGNIPTNLGGGYPDWKYFKESDKLLFYGWVIYQQGKWVERVKERATVNPLNIQAKHESERVIVDFTFSIKGDFENLNGSQSFLTSQLEKYLNGEIE